MCACGYVRTAARYDLRPVARWPWRRIVKIAWPGPINTSAAPRSLPRVLSLSLAHADSPSLSLARSSLCESRPLPFLSSHCRPCARVSEGRPPRACTPLSARENGSYTRCTSGHVNATARALGAEGECEAKGEPTPSRGKNSVQTYVRARATHTHTRINEGVRRRDERRDDTCSRDASRTRERTETRRSASALYLYSPFSAPFGSDRPSLSLFLSPRDDRCIPRRGASFERPPPPHLPNRSLYLVKFTFAVPVTVSSFPARGRLTLCISLPLSV